MHPQRACLLPKSHLVYLFQSDSFWSYEVWVWARQVCLSLRFEGKFADKYYKVAGVAEGFDAGISPEEMANHVRWKSSSKKK